MWPLKFRRLFNRTPKYFTDSLQAASLVGRSWHAEIATHSPGRAAEVAITTEKCELSASYAGLLLPRREVHRLERVGKSWAFD